MDTGDLFDTETGTTQPLAARVRPRDAEAIAGQKHLLAPGKPLWEALKGVNPHSMVLWGPPGSGKTTIASVIARAWPSRFVSLSATLAGVKDVRRIADQARRSHTDARCATILFVDEIHRFNKAQQDAFSPYIEDGTIIFIGATTENPSFELNDALLSRVRVYVLKCLEESDLVTLIKRASNVDAALRGLNIDISERCCRMIARSADGDARKALNLLEICSDLTTRDESGTSRIDEETIRLGSTQNLCHFDKRGDLFYDQISALHKSVRGSDPDAALYWLSRMLGGGGDPLYIVRRLLRIASEDIGTANNRAWDMALNAWLTYERLGSPEGELAIAHAVIYLACSPKSNAVYTAFGSAGADARKYGALEVPNHLRNAPTNLLKQLGAGKGYRYAHDEKEAFAAGENYFPEKIAGRHYYKPGDSGDEAALGERLRRLRKLNARARHKDRSKPPG